MPPGDRFVVGDVVGQAAVEDADEAVAEGSVVSVARPRSGRRTKARAPGEALREAKAHW